MDNRSDIERVVMRRIHIIRAFRMLLSFDALVALVLVVALWGIGREVWVARVLENAPRDAAALPKFYLDAFEHTRPVVQALALLTLASLIYLARETARAISSVLIRQQQA